jgi:hypothetical protein
MLAVRREAAASLKDFELRLVGSRRVMRGDGDRQT